MRFLALLILAVSLHAGQSIVLGNSPELTGSCPQVDATTNVRVEFQIHDLATASSNQQIFHLSCLGMTFYAYTTGELELLEQYVASGGTRRFSDASRTNILVRAQRNIDGTRTDVEIWNHDGTGYEIKSLTGLSYTQSGFASGAVGRFTTAGDYPQLAFLRGYTTLVPLGSRPPTTASVGTYIDWKLDGNGNDSSGNSRTLNTSGASFETTPDQGTFAFARTAGATTWSDAIPLRAGQPSQLDGTSSYSLADEDDTVVCFWQQLDGPSTAIFDDRTSCEPTLTGLIFGPYTFRLVAMGDDGSQALATLETGAVASDDKGVVIYPDDRLNTLLGPTKVLGQHDYEWFDARLTFLAQENWKNYEINGGPWFLEQEKTSIGGIVREGTIYATHDGTKIYGVGTNFLPVFCGGRVGPALKSVYSPYVVALIPQGEGVAPIPYARIVESCQSDTELTMISGWNWGADTVNSPGVPWGTYGMANYRQDGSGTVYTNTGVSPLKIYGTGTDFLARFCGGVVGPTALNGPGIIVFEAASTTRLNVESCQSNTEITLASYSPWTSSNVASPGVAWGYETASNGSWAVNANTINYYDVALGLYKLYYRSGWAKARDAARWLADRYYRAQGILGGSGRALSPLSAVVRHVVDTEGVTYPNFWPFFRSHVDYLTTNVNPPGCMTTRVADFREDTYCVLLVALQALYETDPDERATARTRLATIYDASVLDQQPDGNYFNEDAGLIASQGAESPVVIVANGSATVTKHSGADFSTDFCGVASSFQEAGTIAVTTGSTAVAGTGTSFTGATGKRIFIRGTYEGQPYSQLNGVAAVADATHLTLEFPWPGSTGTATDYRIQSKVAGPYFDSYAFGVKSVNASGYATGAAVVDADNWYWCTRDSGTQLTLDKPYTGDTSTNSYRKLMNGFAGRGSQPFMMGLGARAFHVAAAALDGFDDTRAAGYRAAAADLVSYLYDYASAPYAHGGVPYFTHYAPCFPHTSIPNACDDNDDPNFRRDFMVETNTAFALDYLAAPDPGKRTAGDLWLNKQFAHTGYANLSAGDGYHAVLIDDCCWLFNLTKLTGQTFGMGGGDNWPAAREGGPAAAEPGAYLLMLTLPAGAADAVVTKALPNGESSTQVCSSFPCALTGVDTRAGGPTLSWLYRAAGGAPLGDSGPYSIRK